MSRICDEIYLSVQNLKSFRHSSQNYQSYLSFVIYTVSNLLKCIWRFRKTKKLNIDVNKNGIIIHAVKLTPTGI
jgi:hypothetical protein